jgi:hypothetical protein
MVLKKSAITPELKACLDAKRAETDIVFAVRLAQDKRMAELRAELDKKVDEVLHVKEMRQNWAIVHRGQKPDFRKVEILYRKPEVGAKVRVYEGEAYLSDDADHLRRLSRALGVKAGSLTLPEAIKWAGVAAKVTDVAERDAKKSFIFAVQTPVMDATPKCKVTSAQETKPITHQEFIRLCLTQDKYLRKLAVWYKANGLVQ